MHHLTLYQLLFLRRRRQWQRLSSRMSLVMVGIALAAGVVSTTPAAAHDPNAVYTAQHRPRVAVSVFEDTNADAGERRYGPSVSAMLVTYFKTGGQLTVVERLDLEQLVQEWERTEIGVTKTSLNERQQLLEIIDVILEGKVTMLPDQTIEIDAKLLAVEDARILAAARKHGPIDCLRQVVDSLGASLQREHLKPFAGNLRVAYDGPPNTRVFLTPVLHVDAPPDARPAVELKATILSSDDARDDRLVQWVTQPSSVTIQDLLTGWYTVRLERPGYRFQDVDNGKFEARGHQRGNYAIFYCRKPHDCRSAQTAEARRNHWGKHLVYVQRFATTELELRSERIPVSKRMGRLRLAVRDEHGQPMESARVMLRSLALEINPWQTEETIEIATTCPDEPAPSPSPLFQETAEVEDGASSPGIHPARSRYPGELGPGSSNTDPRLAIMVERLLEATHQLMAASPHLRAGRERTTAAGPGTDDKSPSTRRETSRQADESEVETCEFLDVQRPKYLRFDERRVSLNQAFDPASFPGGDLLFQQYSGQEVPVGHYELVVWAPNYRTYHRRVDVHRSSWEEPLTIDLQRLERSVELLGWPDGTITFTGITTSHHLHLDADQIAASPVVQLPVDRYHALVRQPEFPDWNRELELRPLGRTPPSLMELRDPCRETDTVSLDALNLEIKNRPWVGGRVHSFLRDPSVFYDPRISELLNRVLDMPSSQQDLSTFLTAGDDLEKLEAALETIDLLVLNEDDVSRLRVLPALRELIHGWLGEGRALLAFVAYQGDYGKALGAPLDVTDNTFRSTLSLKSKLADELALEANLDLAEPRLVPKLDPASLSREHWRVLGVEATNKQQPRILESLQTTHGGYVMVWLETIQVRAVHKNPAALFTFGDVLRSGARRGAASAVRGLGSGYQHQRRREARYESYREGGDRSQAVRAEAEGGAVAGITGKAAETLERADNNRMSARQRNRLKLDDRRVREANTQILLLKTEIQNRALERARALMRERLELAQAETPSPETHSVDEITTTAVTTPLQSGADRP